MASTTATASPEQFWGYLIAPDKAPTPVFERLLLSIAAYIDQRLPPCNLGCLPPAKLAEFYRLVGGNYDPLFIETPWSSLSWIYQSLGCFHSLQPGQDPYQRPALPALTPHGFVRWQTVQLLLGPEEHGPFLQKAVQTLDLVSQAPFPPFPKTLPPECLPRAADPEMIQWHESVGQKLRHEVEVEAQEHAQPPSRSYHKVQSSDTESLARIPTADHGSRPSSPKANPSLPAATLGLAAGILPEFIRSPFRNLKSSSSHSPHPQRATFSPEARSPRERDPSRNASARHDHHGHVQYDRRHEPSTLHIPRQAPRQRLRAMPDPASTSSSSSSSPNPSPATNNRPSRPRMTSQDQPQHRRHRTQSPPRKTFPGHHSLRSYSMARDRDALERSRVEGAAQPRRHSAHGYYDDSIPAQNRTSTSASRRPDRVPSALSPPFYAQNDPPPRRPSQTNGTSTMLPPPATARQGPVPIPSKRPGRDTEQLPRISPPGPPLQQIRSAPVAQGPFARLDPRVPIRGQFSGQPREASGRNTIRGITGGPAGRDDGLPAHQRRSDSTSRPRIVGGTSISPSSKADHRALTPRRHSLQNGGPQHGPPVRDRARDHGRTPELGHNRDRDDRRWNHDR